MSNKYQEALERIFPPKYFNNIFPQLKGIMTSVRIEIEDFETLKELVNKETSMKVTDIHVDEFYCPKCHSEISHDKYNSEHPKYCEECGQKLDWGEYE